MTLLNSRSLHWIARLILGVAFLYAAIIKIAAPLDFADSIAAFQILPTALINIIALGLPWFELACSLMVLTGFHLRAGALGLVAMLTVFTIAIASALLRGLSIDCGCFGSHSWLDSNPWIALLRDVIFLTLALFLSLQSLRQVGNSQQGLSKNLLSA